MEGRPVATWRVIYVPRPGVRFSSKMSRPDALRQTTAHIELTLDTLVVGQPREVTALRARRRDVTAVLRLCLTPARWGGVRLRR